MTLRRKILLILLIIPATMMLISIGWPGAGFELTFLVLGVPILVLNAWEFFSPEDIDFYFGKPKSMPVTRAVGQKGFFMKNKSILALIVSVSILILLVIGYALLRSNIDHVSFLYALNAVLIKLGNRLWHLLSVPAIFIALLVFLLLWILNKPIGAVIKGTRGSEHVQFPDVFRQPILRPVSVESLPTGKKNASEVSSTITRLIGQGIDPKAVQLMLEIDGIDVTKPYVLSKINALSLNFEEIPPNAGKVQKEAFYHGVFETLYGYLLPIFCTVETKNNDKVARFTLKPGVREEFMERLNQANNPPESVAI